MAGSFVSIMDRIVKDHEESERARRLKLAAERGVEVVVIEAEERQAQLLREAEWAERERQAEEERRQKAEAAQALRVSYGHSIGLPVPAHIGHIIRLAGLTERSSCNGMVSNTVWHVVVDGDMTLGRISRKKGDLLCRKASTLGHRKSLGISGTASWTEEDFLGWERITVNCAACRGILQRLRQAGE